MSECVAPTLKPAPGACRSFPASKRHIGRGSELSLQDGRAVTCIRDVLNPCVFAARSHAIATTWEIRFWRHAARL
jgi:hypothetical protein